MTGSFPFATALGLGLTRLPALITQPPSASCLPPAQPASVLGRPAHARPRATGWRAAGGHRPFRQAKRYASAFAARAHDRAFLVGFWCGRDWRGVVMICAWVMVSGLLSVVRSSGRIRFCAFGIVFPLFGRPRRRAAKCTLQIASLQPCADVLVILSRCSVDCATSADRSSAADAGCTSAASVAPLTNSVRTRPAE